MKTVTIKRKIALDALALGGSFAGKNKVIPITDCVKCKFSPNGAFVVSSHDGSHAIVKRVECATCSEESVFCVNYADFTKALKSLSCEDVILEISETLLTIVHKKGKIELPIFGVEEFPNVELGEAKREILVPSLTLKEWVSTARNFVAVDEVRPAMCGMYLYIKNNEVGVCATNGHKLYTDSYINEGYENDDLSAIIPSVCLSPILGVIGDSDNVNATLYGRNITFGTSDTKITCLLQEARYPNFKAVIPQSHTIEVECSVSELYESVSRICTVTNLATRLVKMDIRGMNMLLECNDMDFSRKANEECMCTNSGGDIVLGVNGEVLCACLGAIDEDKVVMRLTAPDRAVVLHDTNSPRKTLLFMPLMLTE